MKSGRDQPERQFPFNLGYVRWALPTWGSSWHDGVVDGKPLFMAKNAAA